MRKASFSVEQITSNTDRHNKREHAPKYLIETDPNFDKNSYQSFYDYEEFTLLAMKKYKSVVGQKMQKKQVDSLFKEAVISMEKHHTEKDIINLFKELKKEYTGHELINLAVHRDEGHFVRNGIEYYPSMHILKKGDDWYTLDENDKKTLDRLANEKDFKPKNEDFKIRVNINKFKKVYNYHAHAVFTHFDLDLGKSARFTKKGMAERYKFVAEQMGMSYAPGTTSQEKKSIKQHKEDLSRVRNIKKQILNQELAKQNDLKQEIKRLRAELQENKATREEHAKLDQLNRDLKAKIKSKELTIDDLTNEVNNLKENLDSLYDVISEVSQKNDIQTGYWEDDIYELSNQLTQKDTKIDELLQENANLKEEIAKKPKIVEKEVKVEDTIKIDQLRNQVKALQSEKKTLTDKVTDLEEKNVSRPNIVDENIEKYKSKAKNFDNLVKSIDYDKNEIKTYPKFVQYIIDTYNSFKAKILNLETENKTLRNENKSLQEQNQVLANKVTTLEEKINSRGNMSDLDRLVSEHNFKLANEDEIEQANKDIEEHFKSLEQSNILEEDEEEDYDNHLGYRM